MLLHLFDPTLEPPMKPAPDAARLIPIYKQPKITGKSISQLVFPNRINNMNIFLNQRAAEGFISLLTYYVFPDLFY